MPDLVGLNSDDFDTEAVLRRAESYRRSFRSGRHYTTGIDSPRHTGSPRLESSPSSIDSPRRHRVQYTSSPTSQLCRESPRERDHPPVIEEVKKMSVTTTSKAGVLAQQIHEEFLTCKICLEAFTNPKSLNCLHTFCEECIENHANSESSYKKYSDYREFTCPLCRKRTTLPPGGVKKLPDNFLVSSLTEVIKREKPSKFAFCDICKLVTKQNKEASSKCLDCNKLLCKSCVEQHLATKVTKGHNVFDVEIEKEIECKEHPDEAVRFYCETCETAICVLCTFNDHKEHEITQFSDAVKQYKADMENLLDDCKGKLESFDEQINVLSNCANCIRTAQEKIKDVSTEMINDIRNREKLLLEEITNLYGQETMALIENRNDLQSDLEGLRSTVQLTELILQGKDMELLLLKKGVQEKLETLSKRSANAMPKTTSKVITFIPGAVDIGYIHDHDRPLLSMTRKAVNCTRSQLNIEDFITTTDTQTDVSSFDRKEQSVNTDIHSVTDESCQTDSSEPPAVHRHYHQSSVDESDAGSRLSRTSYNEDDSTALRRRRRRERARTARIDNGERYSYPSERVPSGQSTTAVVSDCLSLPQQQQSQRPSVPSSPQQHKKACQLQ